MFNRVAFVTGASRGIGRAIALSLCRSRIRHRGGRRPRSKRTKRWRRRSARAGGEAMTVELDRRRRPIRSKRRSPKRCKDSAASTCW